MPILKKPRTVSVDEFTTPSPVVVSAESLVEEVAQIMTSQGFRHVPVVDENRQPIGILSDRDLKMVSNFDIMKALKVKDLMTPEPFVVSADESLEEVALVMSKQKWGSALVVYPEDKELGIFTSTDALNALVECLRGEVGSSEATETQESVPRALL